jgi:hypothetical protein
MSPIESEIKEEEVLSARRDLSIRGVGLVFLVNGLLLAFFWSLCYKALGGVLSAQPEAVAKLAVNGYAIIAFACFGYLLIMDMETVIQDGRETARRITLDWIWWCLLPLAAYISVSALALGLPLPEPRQVAAAEGLLSASLVLYGFLITRHHTPSFLQKSPSHP